MADMLSDIKRAADAIKHAKALVVTAGAGMGVDSGLPDFRGKDGFWRAYPPLKKLGVQLTGMSNPVWFSKDPSFAWGFFGHRYNLYASTEPHQGFTMLLNWAKQKPLGHFVFTSNVDGHFQKAGFEEDSVVECHGSINFMQMTNTDISEEIWPVKPGTVYDVDMDTLRMRGTLPQGPPKGASPELARPNILMFGDWGWQGDRTSAQEQRFHTFIHRLETECGNSPTEAGKADVVIIEIGAGLAVPTVRYTSETLASNRHYKGLLIRINPNEPEVPDRKKSISLEMTGLAALREIEKHL